MASIYDWSLEADKNGNSDGLINWEHGQPPSSVNGSARAMMKRIAEYIMDLSGTALVSGDGNSVTVNLTSNVTEYKEGLKFSFKANSTNTQKMQLQVGTLPFLPVFYTTEDGLIELNAEICRENGLYEVIYSKHLGKKGGWFLTNPTQIIKKLSAIPTGSIIHYVDDKFNQAEWLICDGSSVSKTKYKDLYKLIGDIWGKSSKGENYFTLPDLRGVFLRGWDKGKGIDANRQFASIQESSNKSHTHIATCSEDGAHTHDILGEVDNNSMNIVYLSKDRQQKGKYVSFEPPPIKSAGAHTHIIKLEPEGGIEARPRNYSLLYLIKT